MLPVEVGALFFSICVIELCWFWNIWKNKIPVFLSPHNLIKLPLLNPIGLHRDLSVTGMLPSLPPSQLLGILQANASYANLRIKQAAERSHAGECNISRFVV